MGRLVVIEGLDGSGKNTQSQLLYDHLISRGADCKKISFPTYTKSSALIEMYLGGEFSANADDVGAYAASAFFAVDRVASFLKDWKTDYDRGAVIIADRYTTSNAIHQLSKLPRSEWDKYLDWLLDFEFGKLGLPPADRVVYLDVPPECSKKLISARYRGDESRRDIHEKNDEYLAQCYKAARFAADRLGFKTVECADERGEIKSRQDIFKGILTELKGII